ncbi:MAG TPA: rhodanese-like domain-containing protein [Atopostipes sp.]|nr:rhodanese-like domain-containing protein [Atopostipes sp.]
MSRAIEKWTVEQVTDQQIVDLRGQEAFQSGHLPGAINLNAKNLARYGTDLLEETEAVVLVLAGKDEEDVEVIVEKAKDAGLENIAGYLVAEELPSEELVTVQLISPEAFMALEEDYQLLDVRHPDEITRPAPEKNLVNIPLDHLAQELGQFDSNKTVFTLCGSGNRSTSAASYLEKKGIQTAVVKGGMGALEPYTKEKE